MKSKSLIILALLTILVFSLTLTANAAARQRTVALGVIVDHTKGKLATGSAASTDQSTTYLTDGVHWANPNVSYKINTSGSSVNSASAINAINLGFSAWENEINPFGLPDKSIINYTYSSSAVKVAGRARFNGSNDISWGRLSKGSIAVTYYWYYTDTKELAEFDMVFNKSYRWATDGNANAFDIQNITTHEAGHTLVLLDLYDSADSELTMYGYGELGETKKRDLGIGDMLGIEAIYPQ